MMIVRGSHRREPRVGGSGRGRAFGDRLRLPRRGCYIMMIRGAHRRGTWGGRGRGKGPREAAAEESWRDGARCDGSRQLAA